jgi:hypothetical protein
MAQQPSDHPAPLIDPEIALRMHFRENRDKFPADQLSAYAGKVVAWWPDGTRIVDADVDSWILWCRLRDSGQNPSFFLYEDIPLPDESFA